MTSAEMPVKNGEESRRNRFLSQLTEALSYQGSSEEQPAVEDTESKSMETLPVEIVEDSPRSSPAVEEASPREDAEPSWPTHSVPEEESPQVHTHSRQVEQAAMRFAGAIASLVSTGLEEHSNQLRGCMEATSGLEVRLNGLGDRFGTLDQSLHGQDDVLRELRALCAKLERSQAAHEQLLKSQEQTILDLRNEIRQRGGLVEKLLSSLRKLDMRGEPRVPVEKAVKVLAGESKEIPTSGRAVNASETGLGLILEAPVLVDSHVLIDAEGARVAGKVVHCSPEGDKYFAGLSSVRELPTEAGGSDRSRQGL